MSIVRTSERGRSRRACVLALSLLGFLRWPVGTAADSGDEDKNELAPVTVTSTRTPELVKDEPLHIETVPAEEIEENLTEGVAPGYFAINALAEIRIGNVGLFVNALNVTNVHQSHYAPLIRPSLGPGGNPITDVWAPLSGRTFNGGVRVQL